MTKVNHSKLPKGILPAAWAIALGAIAPMLDSTMINIAIKQLTADFNSTLNVVQWTITGYILALAVAVPISGWLVNKWNGKHIFIWATVLFGLTSIFTGFSWNILSLIFFRLLQGFCAGIITPMMSTLLVKTAGSENLGRVIAIVSTPMILGPILGPVLGGVIIQFASWRFIFFINIGISFIAVPLMINTIPNFAPFNKSDKLDWRGIILLSFLSAAFIYGISKATDYTTFLNIKTITWCCLGLIAVSIYIIHNRHWKNQVVLPLHLFRRSHFTAANIGLFLANAAIIGPMLILPLFFQQFRHFTPIEAALTLAPQGIGMIVTRPFIGQMIDKFGAKYVTIISLLLSLVGSIPLLFMTPHTSLLWIAIILFIRGTCVGGINLPLTSDAYIGLNSKQYPQASISINMVENLGSSFGSALIATVVATFTANSQNINAELQGYHAGFFVSVIALILLFIPSLFLNHKKASASS